MKSDTQTSMEQGNVTLFANKWEFQGFLSSLTKVELFLKDCKTFKAVIKER